MDNQLLIVQAKDFKTFFRQNHQKTLNLFYIFICLLGVISILFILSSVQLKQKEYHNGLQVGIVIVSASFGAFLIASIYLVCSTNGSSTGFTFVSLIVFLLNGISCTLTFISQVLRIFDSFCNYNVTHSEPFDGYYIISHLNSYNYSVCSSITHSNSPSVVYNLSLQYLSSLCNKNATCIDQDSLTVYYMYDEASFQLATLIIAGIFEFLYIFVIIKIRNIIKSTNLTVTGNPVINEVIAVQQVSPNRIATVSPVQVNPQIIIPPPPRINQGQLNNQNCYNNPVNYSNQGYLNQQQQQQQQFQNPGMQYQQQQYYQ